MSPSPRALLALLGLGIAALALLAGRPGPRPDAPPPLSPTEENRQSPPTPLRRLAPAPPAVEAARTTAPPPPAAPPPGEEGPVLARWRADRARRGGPRLAICPAPDPFAEGPVDRGPERAAGRSEGLRSGIVEDGLLVLRIGGASEGDRLAGPDGLYRVTWPEGGPEVPCTVEGPLPGSGAVAGTVRDASGDPEVDAPDHRRAGLLEVEGCGGVARVRPDGGFLLATEAGPCELVVVRSVAWATAPVRGPAVPVEVAAGRTVEVDLESPPPTDLEPTEPPRDPVEVVRALEQALDILAAAVPGTAEGERALARARAAWSEAWAVMPPDKRRALVRGMPPELAEALGAGPP